MTGPGGLSDSESWCSLQPLTRPRDLATMTVTPQQIEDKLRAAIQVDHLVRVPQASLMVHLS